MKRLLIIFAVLILAGGAFMSLKTRVHQPEKFSGFKEMFFKARLPVKISGSIDLDSTLRLQYADTAAKVNDTVAESLSNEYRSYRRNIFGYKQYIPELKVSSFSREVTSNCSAVACLYDNDKICALCYFKDNGFYDQYGTNQYILATFDNATGRRIDELVFAGQESAFKFSSGMFDANRMATVSFFENTWENDPKTSGYENNKVTKTTWLKSAKYQLDDDGHFRKLSETVVADAK